MTEITIVVPVLARPANARPLVESVLAATQCDWELVFVCSPGDTDQIEACDELASWPNVRMLITGWPAGKADWARKCELARHATDAPYLLLGADDIRFQPGWDSAVLELFDGYDVGVVGTNDLANPSVVAGAHSTHPVVARCYADTHGTIDDPDLMLPDCYWHNWVDSELVETAKARGCFAFAPDARVPHSHPIFDRSVPLDATYRLGRERYAEDRALFESRRHLWARAGARAAVPA